MNTRTTIAAAGLLAVVVAFGVGLGVVFATDDEAGDSSMGMMDAMGDMDSGTCVEHMRDVLGEDGFGRMLDHLREHQDGGLMTSGQAADDMMHRMMDSMMEDMPKDEGAVKLGGSDTHHGTSAPSATSGQ